jgi:hypothetical protein
MGLVFYLGRFVGRRQQPSLTQDLSLQQERRPIQQHDVDRTSHDLRSARGEIQTALQ